MSVRVFLKDYHLDISIGVYDHEKLKTQRVSVTVEAGLAPSMAVRDDDIDTTVSYVDFMKIAREIADAGHIHLVETYAEQIAEAVLKGVRVQDVRVRVEKLEIVPPPGVVGTEIHRFR